MTFLREKQIELVALKVWLHGLNHERRRRFVKDCEANRRIDQVACPYCGRLMVVCGCAERGRVVRTYRAIRDLCAAQAGVDRALLAPRRRRGRKP